jgi:hypothetical protein
MPSELIYQGLTKGIIENPTGGHNSIRLGIVKLS